MDNHQALERAILYIESHLYEDIRPEDAALEAGYSYFHLTRLFSAVIGESIGSYIRKRRLANAARQLLYTDRRILDIAVDHGFESGEAFCRAFRTVYRTSPTKYRQNRIEAFAGTKPRIDSNYLNHLVKNVTVHPKIIELPDILVAGIRGRTTLCDNTISALWKQFWSEMPKIPHAVSRTKAYGICEACSNGHTLYTMNSELPFSEVVGIEVASFEQLEAPFTSKIIKGGRYAVFTHTGSLKNLPLTFQYIWGTWLTASNEQLDNRDDFEYYDERYLGYDNPKSQIDLCIPIK